MESGCQYNGRCTMRRDKTPAAKGEGQK